jgi:alpha-2-macroglobulin
MENDQTTTPTGSPGGQPPSSLRRLIGRLGALLSLLRQALSWVVGSLRWTPPGWLLALAGLGSRLGAALVGLAARRRALARGLAAGFGLAVVLTGALGYWWSHRPRPLELSVDVSAPSVTAIEAVPKPYPLRVRFGGSAARLERIGKPLAQGARLDPQVPGEWKFEDDRTLVFRPAQDWGVGQRYRVLLERSLFPEAVLLETYQAEFTTAPFEAHFARAEFYQDPTNAQVKRVVATIAFSHPVDGADLARRVSLRIGAAKGGLHGLGARSEPVTLSFDKLKGEAYLQSEPIAIPAEDTQAVLTISAGARAARGGTPLPSDRTAQVRIPGMYSYFRVSNVEVRLVPNEKNEPEQVVMVSLSAGATEAELAQAVSAWILPKDRPATDGQEAVKDYRWHSIAEIGPEILARATRLELGRIPAERNDAELHAFKIQAPVGAHLYVVVKKGTRSFGGYVLPGDAAEVLRVPEYPKEVKIAQPGAILSLSGEKKVSIFARDVEALRLEVARVLPGRVAHLVTQSSGTFAEPSFEHWRFGPDDLTERFEEQRTLQHRAPGKAQYAAFDLAPYLGEGASRHGVFLFKVESWDPARKRSTGVEDRRLLLVTDLGLVVKRNADRSHDVFVQAINAGEPAAGVTVQVLGRNGLPIASATTDGEGHARLPRLDDFKHEKAPVAYLARRGDDLSFLPYDRADRQLELSRFDVGGVVTGGRGGRLDAFVFSDRGLYRPGDAIHVAAVVKGSDWRTPLGGVPLEAVFTDARGLEVQKERVALPASGFLELGYRTEETSPTGQWAANLYLVEADGQRGALLGSTAVRVAEFMPDRLRLAAHFSTERAEGWVSPADLKALVSLQNLFGTPAEARRITSELTLAPARPAFRAWKDWIFADPLEAKSSFTERLEDATTDARGEATIALGLERFEKATYRLTFSAQGYEAEGGRGVTTAASLLVSPLPFLVGYKADGDLRYVSRGSDRSVQLTAVGPDLAALEAKGLELELIELRWVSVLARQGDGTYRYESVRRELSRSKKPLALPQKGLRLPLPTGDAGDFALVVRGAGQLELARVAYAVAGDGNVTRALEKNAELQVKLARGDWAPGEAIELQVTAPYTGAGLITVERDRVYAWKWFKASTTSSVQRIVLPPELEGNGYVSVAFVRGLDSPEVFTSPLSHGVAPFSVSRQSRTNDVELSAPDVARPGEEVRIRYHARKAGKAVVFAVDEGILQVARYQTPDPLGHFFQKRALEVRTDQLLDLILPEFSVVQARSAAGGDQGSALARNLNPFKRKRDRPAVYWSGLVDVDATDRELRWTVPETFSGAVRIMAVAVSPDAVGAGARKALVRGHFVLSPNVPTFVAPGDTFEVSVGVANNVEGSGAKAVVRLHLAASELVEPLDGGERTLEVGEGRETSATFRLKARARLGSASLRFTAALGERRSALSTDLSVRPASPYETVVHSGRLAPGKQEEAKVTRALVPELRTLELSASALPLGLSRGLAAYLARFPHGCTEQLVSQAFPAIVLRGRPELGYAPEKAEEHLRQVLKMLRSRQNAEGAFGMWAGNGVAAPFPTLYALHFLTEARERGHPVPADVLARGLGWARGLAAGTEGRGQETRLRAYALYLLARNGQVPARELAALREQLDARKNAAWQKDLTGVWLAATYGLLKQEGPARRLLSGLELGQPQETDYARFYDGLVRDSALLYVLSRHFPERLPGLPPAALDALTRPIQAGGFSTLTAASAIVAFDAYAQAAGTATSQVEATVAELLQDGKARPVGLPGGLFPRAPFGQDARALRFTSTGALPVFWQAVEAGFDVAPPAVEVKDQLEVFRELRGRDGKPATTTRLGEELTVHLRLRALGGWHANVAVVDLLPGGFEPVLEDRPVTEQGADGSGEADGPFEGEGEGDDAEAAAPTSSRPPPMPAAPATVGALPIGLESSSWHPEYADVREDRVVLYGTVGPEAQEFVYRVKATNRGTFVLPPPYAESMYQRTVKARGLPGQITVGQGG